jgi:hypothetical protein
MDKYILKLTLKYYQSKYQFTKELLYNTQYLYNTIKYYTFYKTYYKQDGFIDQSYTYITTAEYEKWMIKPGNRNLS